MLVTIPPTTPPPQLRSAEICPWPHFGSEKRTWAASPVSFAATEERLAGGTYDRTAPATADANSLGGIPSALANALILSSTLSSLAYVCDLLSKTIFHHEPTSALLSAVRYERKAPSSAVSPTRRYIRLLNRVEDNGGVTVRIVGERRGGGRLLAVE